MWLLIPMFWKLPLIALLWLGKPFTPRTNRYDDTPTDKDGFTKIGFYAIRWLVLIPAGFLGITVLLTLIFVKPWIFLILLALIALVDGVMIGLRALWLRDQINNATGTEIVVADHWKDKG